MYQPHVLITYPFPLGRPSGGARMTREIARNLGRAGARVTVLPVSANLQGRYPRPPVEREHLGFEFDEELAADGVTIRRVDPHPLHWTLDALAVRRAVRQVLARTPADVVLSYYTEGAFLPGFLRARGVTFGFIATWQSYARAMSIPMKGLPQALSRRIRARLLARPYRDADVCFATSRFTKSELVSVLGVEEQRIVHCPLGVDASFFAIPRERPERIARLLFFGRIMQSKGVLDMLEALGRLRREGHDFRLRIRGLGLDEMARRAAREHGIGEWVEVLGPAGDAELAGELERAHLAILPSHFEAFGLAFAEAQAAGLPVVAYDAGSVPEVVQDGVTGWLAPLRDVGALGDCIARALAEPIATHAAGLAGREHVRRTFTWERTAARILDGVRAVRAARRGEEASVRA